MSHAPHATTCANCQAPVSSPYCGQCGQATHVGRLSLLELAHDTWHALTHADKGILRLSLDLLRRPRPTYLDYFAGQRRRYFSPVLYFLLFAGALAVLYPYVFDYEDHVNGQHNEFGRELYHLIKYRTLALLPVQVALTWLVFRRQFNLSEITVFWLFCLGFTFVVRLILLPLYFPFINHKQLLDWVFEYLAAGFVLGHLLVLFARRSWLHRAWCVALLLISWLLDFLLQGYLIFGGQLWQRLHVHGLGELLRVAFLPG